MNSFKSELAILKLGKKEVCNPAIAMATRHLAICKQAGSGTLDMIEQCRKTGLSEPEFRLDGGCFVLTIHRKIAQEPEQVTRQVSDKYPTSTRQVTPQQALVLEGCSKSRFKIHSSGNIRIKR